MIMVMRKKFKDKYDLCEIQNDILKDKYDLSEIQYEILNYPSLSGFVTPYFIKCDNKGDHLLHLRYFLINFFLFS